MLFLKTLRACIHLEIWIRAATFWNPLTSKKLMVNYEGKPWTVNITSQLMQLIRPSSISIEIRWVRRYLPNTCHQKLLLSIQAKNTFVNRLFWQRRTFLVLNLCRSYHKLKWFQCDKTAHQKFALTNTLSASSENYFSTNYSPPILYLLLPNLEKNSVI